MKCCLVLVCISTLVILIVNGRKCHQKHKLKQSKDEFIIGGDLINIARVPYQCALTIYDLESDGSVNCGCSIINEWFVLTAAHCFNNFANKGLPYQPNEQFEIVITTGTNDNSVYEDGFTYKAIDFAVHEDYPHPELDAHIADIALILVDGPIQFYNDEGSKYVSSIELVNNNDYKNGGYDVYTSGYGLTVAPEDKMSKKSYNSKLYGVWLKTLSTNKCKQIFHGNINFDHFICAGSPNEHIQGACIGDSGGPLVAYKSDNDPVLIGVVSFGDGKCEGAAQYTNVYVFRDWILQKMEGMRR